MARPVSGQVGQGDLLDRLQPCPITRLNRLGIVKIATGEKHAIAITVTGRALGWGDNAQKQVVAGSQTAASFSFPQDIGLPEGETARDAVASGNQTVILCDSGRLYHNSDFSSAKLSFTQLHPNKNVRNMRLPPVKTKPMTVKDDANSNVESPLLDSIFPPVMSPK